jgi:hypothetical protein
MLKGEEKHPSLSGDPLNPIFAHERSWGVEQTLGTRGEEEEPQLEMNGRIDWSSRFGLAVLPNFSQ